MGSGTQLYLQIPSHYKLSKIVINPSGHIKLFKKGVRSPFVQKLATDDKVRFSKPQFKSLMMSYDDLEDYIALEAAIPKKVPASQCIETTWKKVKTNYGYKYVAISLPAWLKDVEMSLTQDRTQGGGHHVKLKAKSNHRKFVDKIVSKYDVLRINGVWLAFMPGSDYDSKAAVWSSLLMDEWDKIKNYDGSAIPPAEAPIRTWRGVKENYKRLGINATKAMQWRRILMNIEAERLAISQGEGQWMLHKRMADDTQAQLAKWEGVKNWGGSKASHQRFLHKVDNYEGYLRRSRSLQHKYKRINDGNRQDLKALLLKRREFERAQTS